MPSLVFHALDVEAGMCAVYDAKRWDDTEDVIIPKTRPEVPWRVRDAYHDPATLVTLSKFAD